jgi:hypothetical protein
MMQALDHILLQTELAAPDRETLKQALLQTKRLTEAENLLLHNVVNSPGAGLEEKLGLLISLLAEHAPQACLNRGAAALSAHPPVPLVYASKQAFSDESAWLLWGLSSQKPAPPQA